MNHKILVYLPSGLGDLMSCRPAFMALKNRFHNSSFAILSNSPLSINSISSYEELFPSNTFSKIILYNPSLSKLDNFFYTTKNIRSYSPDLVVNFVLCESLR